MKYTGQCSQFLSWYSRFSHLNTVTGLVQRCLSCLWVNSDTQRQRIFAFCPAANWSWNFRAKTLRVIMGTSQHSLNLPKSNPTSNHMDSLQLQVFLRLVRPQESKQELSASVRTCYRKSGTSISDWLEQIWHGLRLTREKVEQVTQENWDHDLLFPLSFPVGLWIQQPSFLLEPWVAFDIYWAKLQSPQRPQRRHSRPAQHSISLSLPLPLFFFFFFFLHALTAVKTKTLHRRNPHRDLRIFPLAYDSLTL